MSGFKITQPRTQYVGLVSNASSAGTATAADIAVLDEGVSLTTSVASLDFVGAGVTATATGDAVTVTIPGATPPTGFVLTTDGGEEDITAHGSTGSTETFFTSGSGNLHTATLNANCTFTFSAVTSGKVCSFTIVLTQDGTGSRLVTWPGSIVWASGTAPVLSTTPAAVDVLTFFTIDGGTIWYGFPTGGSGSVSPLTTKGDLYTYSTVDARLPVGTNGYMLTPDSTQTTGLKWQSLSAAVAALGFVGPLLISDTPSTPLVFADILQNDAQTDFLYADIP